MAQNVFDGDGFGAIRIREHEIVRQYPRNRRRPLQIGMVVVVMHEERNRRGGKGFRVARAVDKCVGSKFLARKPSQTEPLERN
jgi:hypothetical protein